MQASLMFHKDVFIPDFAHAPLFEGAVTYSRHAKHVSSGEGSLEEISLPPLFVAKNAVLVEAELNPTTGVVEKQVWRQSLDANRDICFAMIEGGFIKTVWLNDKTDTHKTLQRGKYIGGFQWRNMKNKLGTKSK